MEYLFSYGTLQLAEVQRSTFGRDLQGHADELVGYALSSVEITDPEVLAVSGQTQHPMLVHTGRPDDRVKGAVFAVTEAELAQADAYEVADYKRVRVTLASNLAAWVYVDARTASPHTR